MRDDNYLYADKTETVYNPFSILSAFSIMQFTKEIKAGDADAFMERMKTVISGIPYDNLVKKDAKLREQNYQTAVYLVSAVMNQFVETEVYCAMGRAACIVQTSDKIYIFELKLDSKGNAEEAIAQIKEKNYAGKYAAYGKEIILAGASFDERKKTIKEWKCEGAIDN